MTETSIALVKSLMSSPSMWSLRPQVCRSPPTVPKVIQDNGADMSRWGLWGFVWIVEICVGCVFFCGETELDMSRLGLEVGSMQCRTNLYNLISMRL